jgi:hypothetical protein
MFKKVEDSMSEKSKVKSRKKNEIQEKKRRIRGETTPFVDSAPYS